ncbi:hypothetical protein [Mycoplasmopsis sturni]|uniref:hypothetical protein n=1 Tax=Mycoplasmopsis sturni TaxID=39047 RepID=UPI00056B549B|nr:hypothetical protein [Mycoplasmopsis sturni]
MLNNFLDSTYTQPSGTVYLYEIDTKDKPHFKKDTVNFVRLKFVDSYEYFEVSKDFNSLVVESDFFTEFQILPDIKIALNEKINFEANKFYLFFKDHGAPELTEENYYKLLDNNNIFVLKDKSLSFSFEAIEAQEVSELTLTPLSTLKELNNIEFIYTNKQIKDPEQISLNLLPGSLINTVNIIYKNPDTKKDYYAKFIYNDSNTIMLPLYCSPFSVLGNKVAWFVWNLSANKQNHFYGLKSHLNDDLSFDLPRYLEAFRIFSNGTYFDTIFEYNYRFLNSINLKELQEKGITNIKDYTNGQIQLLKSRYADEKARNKLLHIIFLASSFVNTDYAFKGGWNNEIELFTLFSFIYDPAKKLFIKSNFISVEKEGEQPVIKWISDNQQFLNFNTYNLEGKYVNLPILPDQIEETDFSQTPVDFNDKTFNFNYPFYVQLNKSSFLELLNRTDWAAPKIYTLVHRYNDQNKTWTDEEVQSQFGEGKKILFYHYTHKVDLIPHQLPTMSYTETVYRYSELKIDYELLSDQQEEGLTIQGAPSLIVRTRKEMEQLINSYLLTEPNNTITLNKIHDINEGHLSRIEIRGMFLENVSITINNLDFVLPTPVFDNKPNLFIEFW